MQPIGTIYFSRKPVWVYSLEFSQNPISGLGEEIVQRFPYIIQRKILTLWGKFEQLWWRISG